MQRPSLFYYSLYLLTTDATFGQARSAIVFFAKSHPSSFGDSQVRAIEDAFDAVGITASFEGGGSGGGENEGWQDESALPQDDDIANGTSGTCPWRISADGCLIVGAGELPSNDNDEYNFWPWNPNSDQVKSVRFNKGVLLFGKANRMFSGCSSLASLEGLSGWDTSSVTGMRWMFSDCASLTSVEALSGWDTSSVADMGMMFYECTSLTSLEGLSGWDTSAVKWMGMMFYGCTSLTSVEALFGWDTSAVTYMRNMFDDCRLIQEYPPWYRG